MAGNLTISLTSLRFHAFHGLYQEEQKTGNEFEVTLRVTIPAGSSTPNNIKSTINYVDLYELIQKVMQEPKELLETVAEQMAEKIHTRFANIKSIEISIDKLAPPIAGIIGRVGVSFNEVY